MTTSVDDELVLLTSFFNLADGRRQDSADTFRVESDVPSSTSPDGNAALYIVTESSAGSSMGVRARRLAAETVAWEYSSHSADPPAVRLRNALRAAHTAVFGEFDGHVTVGLSLMAVEGDSVYLGQVPPAQVYVLHDASLHSISAAATGGSSYARALGTTGKPQISVFRDQISMGDILALCSTWFQRTVDPDDLRSCFSSGAPQDITACMEDLAQDHDARTVTAIVIEAASAQEVLEAERPSGPGFMQQVDGAVSAIAGVGRMLWQEFRSPTTPPAEVNGTERPVARVAVLDETPATEPAVEHTQTARSERHDMERNRQLRPSEHEGAAVDESWREHLTEEMPVVPASEPEPLLDAVTDTDSSSARASGARPVHPSPGEPAPVFESEPDPQAVKRPTEPLSELDRVNSRLHDGADMADVIPPVQAFPDTSTEPERIYATNKDVQAANRRPRRFGGIGRPVGDGPPVIRPGMSGLDLSRPTTRGTPPSIVWLVIALAGVLLVASALLFITHHRSNAPAVAVNPYPTLASKDIQRARNATDKAQQDRYLNQAKREIALARQNGATPAQIAELKTKLQDTTDTLHNVTRETNPVTLGTFQQPTEIAVTPDTILVVDAGRKSVFTVSGSPGASPTEVMRSGDIVGPYTLGIPQHVATDGPEIMVLDDHNTLVRDTGGDKTATALTQAAPKETAVAMNSFDPDVFVLDSGSSQIWRYPAAASSATYNPSGQSFFNAGTPNLAHAVSFTLDGSNLFVLNSDGAVLKYDMQGNSQKFDVTNVHTPTRSPTWIFTDQGLKYVWIADPQNGRILQLDRSGHYVRAYRSASSAMDLHQIQSIAVPPKGNVLYVVSGSKLFSFPVIP